MADKLIKHADKLCGAVHFVAWCAAAVLWALNWWRDGPAPSGPLYNSAKNFIGHLDILVHGSVQELSTKVAQGAAAWFSADLGASFTIAFGCIILLAGTVQWIGLGRLVQWTAARAGATVASALLGLYAVWAGGALFLWIAS